MSMTVPVASTGSVAAQRVLEAYWDGNLPIRPEIIASKMNVSVVGRGGQGDFDYPYSGFFEYRNGTPTIEYNTTDPLLRKRFTVAHELGHFALGHQCAPRDYPESFGSGNGSYIERQANQFAAELLMPAHMVQTLIMSGKSSIEELADAFAVSKVAMGYRLNNLGAGF